MLRAIGRASWKELLLAVPICNALAYRADRIHVTATGVVTLAVILWLTRMPAVLLWLGDFSYSLYLLHDMVGRRIVHIGARFLPAAFKSTLPIFAVLCSILCALIMFRLVELPAKRMAAKWRYVPEADAPRAAAAAAGESAS